MPGSFLTHVLGQNEHLQGRIAQSAEELSTATSAIRQAVASGGPPPGLTEAVDTIETVTKKLQEACDRLRAVNQALQVEIRERTLLDHQLAAAVEQEEGARRAALHDPLTGLPNRMLFRDRLEHGIAQARRHRWILAVMFLDIDNFKSINDTYGHQAGDAVLQTVALRLGTATRNEDTVSRYGGDEFLYLLTPLHEQKHIARIAAKILKAVRAPCGISVGDVIVNLCIEASIGISVFPKDGDTAAGLIARADEAMYGAKEHKSGFAFAQEKAALGSVPHRQAIGSGIASPNAARVFDDESSKADFALPGKGRQKVRAH
jgi:diguanylate cyclase (GGDEF)-like protein